MTSREKYIEEIAYTTNSIVVNKVYAIFYSSYLVSNTQSDLDINDAIDLAEGIVKKNIETGVVGFLTSKIAFDIGTAYYYVYASKRSNIDSTHNGDIIFSQ